MKGWEAAQPGSPREVARAVQAPALPAAWAAPPLHTCSANLARTPRPPARGHRMGASSTWAPRRCPGPYLTLSLQCTVPSRRLLLLPPHAHHRGRPPGPSSLRVLCVERLRVGTVRSGGAPLSSPCSERGLPPSCGGAEGRRGPIQSSASARAGRQHRCVPVSSWLQLMLTTGHPQISADGRQLDTAPTCGPDPWAPGAHTLLLSVLK